MTKDPAMTDPASLRHGALTFTVDELAQEIRRVDGNHSLGAGALAEALTPFLVKKLIQHRARIERGRDPAPQAGEVEKAEDVAVWSEGIVTDGTRLAFAQKAEADYGGTYWAIDEDDGALEWEPTHFIARGALEGQ